MGEELEIASLIVLPATTAAVAAAAPIASQSAIAKKSSADGKTKKRRSKPNHPKIAEMVDAAISAMKERRGSSLQAIKRYISSTYYVDSEKLAPFVKKYLRAAVISGGLVQTRGHGVTGSFKLAAMRKRRSVSPKNKLTRTRKSVTTQKVVTRMQAAATSPVAKKMVTKKSKIIGGRKRKLASKGPASKPPKAKINKAKVVVNSTTKKVATSKMSSPKSHYKIIETPAKRGKKMSSRKTTAIAGQ